jgi:hypothetical protein
MLSVFAAAVVFASGVLFSPRAMEAVVRRGPRPASVHARAPERRDVPERPWQSVALNAGGSKMCGLDSVPEEFLAKSPFKTREGLQRMLDENKDSAFALSKGLKETLAAPMATLTRCYLATGGPEAAFAIEWTVSSSARVFTARGATVAPYGDGAASPVVRERLRACLDETGLSAATFSRAAGPPLGSFVDYDGPYWSRHDSTRPVASR